MRDAKPKKDKKLGLAGIILVGLSGAIGFEVFVLLDYAYFNLAGDGIFWALGLAAAINIIIMLSYCELGAAMPIIGGEYTYIKTAYGGYISFMAGCFRWIASIFGAALAAVTFALQIVYLSSIVAPQAYGWISAQVSLIAIIVVFTYAALEIKGIKKISDLIVVFLVALFLIFIVGGLVLGPVQEAMKPEPLIEGFGGVLAATVYIFPIFFGMRSLVAIAPNAKNASTDVPKGLLLSAIIIIPLYIGLAYVATTAATAEGAQSQVPILSYAATRIFGPSGGVLFALAGMGASLAALGTSLTVQSSILRGMSRDTYLPKILLHIHKRFGTHYVALIVGSIFILMLSSVGAVPFLAYAVSFGSLLVFALVNLSVLRLRRKKPHMDRPFKTPLYPFTPLAGVFLSGLLLFLPLIIGDVNAGDATISAVGLICLVVATYYVRMLGKQRLQIGFGGIGVGMGVLAVISGALTEARVIPAMFPFIPNYIQILAGLPLIIGGYLNIVASSSRRNG